MLLLNIVYIRVFYYNIVQGQQFDAVDKFERSDTAQAVLGSIPNGNTSFFLMSTSLHDVICMCSLRAPVPPKSYYNYFLCALKALHNVFYVHQYPLNAIIHVIISYAATSIGACN